MGHWEREIGYRCSDDCKQSGCPGHTMKVEIFTVTDSLKVTPDIKDGTDFFYLDTNRFETLKKVLKEWDYSGFNF